MAEEIQEEISLQDFVRSRLTSKGFLKVVQDAIPPEADFDAKQLAWVCIVLIETPNERTGNLDLQQCEITSLQRAVLHCAEVGLEPGNGDCWILPRARKAYFQMGALGYITLALRHGARRAWAEVLYEADSYRIVKGEFPTLEHEITDSVFLPGGNVDFEHKRVVPVAEGGRGRPLGAYACIENADGSVNWSVVSETECQQARNTSKAKNSPAYTNWPDEMRKRTAIARARKMWPRKALARAIEAEERDSLQPKTEMSLQSVQNQALPEAKPKSGLDSLVASKKAQEPAQEVYTDHGGSQLPTYEDKEELEQPDNPPEMTEEERLAILEEEKQLE